ADGRVRLGGDLDEVEVGIPGDREGLGQGLDADLLTIRADEPYLSGTNPLVDPGLVVRRRSYRRSLLMYAQTPPYACRLFSNQRLPQNDETDAGEADVRRRAEPAATGRPGRTGGPSRGSWPGGGTCDLTAHGRQAAPLPLKL